MLKLSSSVCSKWSHSVAMSFSACKKMKHGEDPH